MTLRRLAAVAASLTFVPAAVVGLSVPPAVAEQKTYPYTIHQHDESESFTEPGLCNQGPALIELSSINAVLHVAATAPDLTDEQVLALLEGGEPVRVTFTQSGNFQVTEADGQVYTGRFTIWFGGNDNPSTDVFSFTFSATGKRLSDGARISVHDVAHGTFKDGEPVVEFDKSHTKGC